MLALLRRVAQGAAPLWAPLLTERDIARAWMLARWRRGRRRRVRAEVEWQRWRREGRRYRGQRLGGDGGY